VPASIPHPPWSEDGDPKYPRTLQIRNRHEVLDAAAQEGMRKVCRLAREVLDAAAAAAVPGVTTDHIDQVVHEECIKRNVSGWRWWEWSLSFTEGAV
jgi:methionyl aminopeptidase